jgi:hypothetical protein
MKKNIFALIFALTFTLMFNTAFAQGPPPPPTGAGHGASGNQPGGNAPIGSGLFILLGLGAAYGGKKTYDMSKEEAGK